MGAGHAYSIDKHMLFDPTDLTDYSKHQDFADKWSQEPVEAQLEALKNTDLFFPQGEDILSQMELVEIESNGEVFHSLDIKDWVNKYYEDGMEFDDAIADVKEQIIENATDASKELGFTEEFGGFLKEEREGDLIVLGEGETNPEGFSSVKYKAALLSDQYNSGVVVFMEDMQGQAYLESVDNDDLLNIVTADYAYQVDFEDIMAVKGSLDPEVVDRFLMDMEDSMTDEELESVLGDKVESFHEYAEHLEDENLGSDAFDGTLRETFAKEIIGRLEAAMNEVSDTFEQFADKTMDGIIQSFPDETFRFATSAWTSAPYKQGKVMFSGSLKSAEPDNSPSP